MSLIATADLAAYLRVNATATVGLQQAIDAAESAVATFIGAASLAKTDLTETLRPSMTSKFLDLRKGPLTAIASITVDGDPLALSDVNATPWHVERLDDKLFGRGSEVVVAYSTGWDSSAPDPKLKSAILMVAASIFNRPDAAAQNVGVQGVTFYRPDYISPTAERILNPFKRIRI